MSGWVAMKELASSLNVFCWLSSSPPPRQQNQLKVTCPGGTVAGATEAGAADDAAALGDDAPLGAGLALPPQAVTSTATTARIVVWRPNRFMLTPPPGPPVRALSIA